MEGASNYMRNIYPKKYTHSRLFGRALSQRAVFAVGCRSCFSLNAFGTCGVDVRQHIVTHRTSIEVLSMIMFKRPRGTFTTGVDAPSRQVHFPKISIGRRHQTPQARLQHAAFTLYA